MKIYVNLIRIILAFFFLAALNIIRFGSFFPVNADIHTWTWLLLSGLVGFVLGDMFLFESFTIIGARIAALIMTAVPIITAFIGWLIMGETLTFIHFIGMFLTISGITIVLFSHDTAQKKFRLTHSVKGILFALLGAIGQAVGLVLSKYGMKDYDPFMATQIRTIAGIAGFFIIIMIFKSWNKVESSFKNKPAMVRIVYGSFFGPFLGVSLSLYSVQHANTGVASTIMAMVPVLIIPPSMIFLKQKITLQEIIGSIISVAGVSLFFIW